jgi:hypothetical protein
MKTGKKTEQFHMMTDLAFLNLIDEWRAKQRPIVTRSEAIRILVLKGLDLSARKRRPSLPPLPQEELAA